MTLDRGTRLGPYEILAPIGAGGMGEVYKARDTRLDRTVAIKVSKEKFSERFEREARSIAALNHPHICQLYDVGPDYLVMEYIEGAPLKGPLPLDRAMKYAGQICDALDAAHKNSITHRDLKPANIMVTKAGVKLLDFGLARIAAGAGDETVTMAVMGTPAYMAPEHWDGKPGDARSDIYAFGCVLYEMLTGKRAAQDRTAIEPPAVEAIVKRCLERDPEDRWQSVRDLQHAIDLPRVSAVQTHNPWRVHAVWIVATVTLLAAVVWFSFGRGNARPSAESVSFAVYPPQGAAFTAGPNTTVNVPQFALAPDGRTLAFVASASGTPPMLWLRPLGEVATHPLPGTENAQAPFWSPDSRWVGFYADGKLKKTPAAGGAVQVLAQLTTDFRGGTWGPDDTIVFGNGSESISRVSAGGSISQVSTAKALNENQLRYPHFLPDGRNFLYTIAGAADKTGVYAGSLDGRTKKLLVRVDSSAVYAPPGYLLFADGDTLMAQVFDAERLEVSGRPVFVAEHAGQATAGLSAVTASRNGTVAYATTLAPDGRLTWFDRGGKPIGSARPDGDLVDFRLSPDERSLATSVADHKAGTVDIWITDLVRGNRTSRFSSGGRPIASPSWSRDGMQLIYRHNRGAVNQFVRRSAGGGGVEELLLTIETERAAQIRGGNIIPTDWSSDGEYVLFLVSAPESGNDLWVLPLAGDKNPYKFLATPAEEMHGNFSPDGHFVAYTSNESGRFEVYVETFPRSERRYPVSTNGGYEPRWRADGREIYYLSEDRKLMAVSVGTGPAFGVPQPLFQTRVPAGVSANRTHYVPSGDGRRFLVNTEIGDPLPTPHYGCPQLDGSVEKMTPGTKLGPYEILAPIGAGGMGEMYKARDTRLDRTVAVKVSKQKFSERFEREARSIAALNHPHICQLYDVGPDYLVMEYVDGAPIRGPLPPEQALRLAQQVADALELAHSKKIIHRDLKPANILLTSGGVKLLDFGLAKSLEKSAGSSADSTVTETQAGTVLGTAAYMAPEQAEGRAADARSDIFSFGVVLYEILTGRRAFSGDTAISTMAAVLHKEPDPLDAPADVTVSGTVRDGGNGIRPGSGRYQVIDEYGTTQPKGTVALAADGSYAFTISLEASRRGDDEDGRQYTIVITAKDNGGNTGSATALVVVPHDQGQ